MSVLFSTVLTLKEPPDEAHAEHLEAFQPDLLSCITPLPYEATTPDPLSSPPVGGLSPDSLQ